MIECWLLSADKGPQQWLFLPTTCEKGSGVEEAPRKATLEMLIEGFREIAVLLIVFAPLDRWVERRPMVGETSFKHSDWELFCL